MKNRILEATLTLAIFFVSHAYGQTLNVAQEEVTDEFEFSDPGINLNESKDSLNPEVNSEVKSEDKSENSFDLSIAPEKPTESNAMEEETVIVRTRETEPPAQNLNPSGLVELRTPIDNFLPYKKRQNDWGFFLSLGMEQTNFPGLLTQVGVTSGDDNSFEDVFGKSPISLFSIEMGPKYNTRVGSFAVLASYGSLSKKSNKLGAKNEVSYQRYSVSALYYMDALFKEPYFVPYVGGGMWKADYRETSTFYPGEVGHYSTEPGMQWRFGALLGLDWIEEESTRRSRLKNGTQGTFLNVYAISNMMSESSPDPDLENNMDIGASLIIEF